MPCRDYEPPWGVGHPDYDRQHKLARMLCGLCKKSSDNIIASVPELWAWWQDHQEQDRKREAAEKAEKERQRKKEIAEFERLKKKLGR